MLCWYLTRAYLEKLACARQPQQWIDEGDSPMESSSFFGPGDIVVDSDFDGIAPVTFDQWLGKSQQRRD